MDKSAALCNAKYNQTMKQSQNIKGDPNKGTTQLQSLSKQCKQENMKYFQVKKVSE